MTYSQLAGITRGGPGETELDGQGDLVLFGTQSRSISDGSLK